MNCDYLNMILMGYVCRECGDLFCRKDFSLKLKQIVYKRYVIPAILYGSEVCCLRESQMEFEKCVIWRAMCIARITDIESQGFGADVRFE